MRSRSSLGTLVVLGASLLVLAEPAFAQCSMCRSVVAQSAEGRALAEQLNGAILLLFVAPYLVVGSVAVVAFRDRLLRHLSRRLRLPFSRR